MWTETLFLLTQVGTGLFIAQQVIINRKLLKSHAEQTALIDELRSQTAMYGEIQRFMQSVDTRLGTMQKRSGGRRNA
jgi:hypothetical protein